MSIRNIPPHVRLHLYLFWAGMVTAGAGIVGFFVSFWQVGSPAAAAVDVHRNVPVLAYASIGAWVVGLGLMWFGRRKLDAALAARIRENQTGLYVPSDADRATGETDASDGRDA